MAVQRPLKTSGNRTFVAERDAGYPIIEAAEVDADLDTIYNAINTGNVVLPALGPNSVGTAQLTSFAVTGAKVAFDTLSGAHLVADSITARELADASVNDTAIVSVNWSKVTGAPTSFPPSGAATGDLTGSSYPGPIIAAGKVTRAKLGSDVAVPAAQPTGGDIGKVVTVTAANTLAYQAIPPPTILPTSITEAMLVTGAVSTRALADGSVTAAKLQPGVIPAHLPPTDGTVTALSMTPDSVGNIALQDEAVRLDNIDQDSVPLPPWPTHGDLGKVLSVIEDGLPTRPTIAWVSPGSAMIGDGDVTTAKLADGAVTRIKLSPVDVLPSLPPLPLVGDANKIVAVNASGTGLIYATAPPATLTPGQVSTIYLADAPNGVTTAKLNDGAVTSAKLGPQAVKTANIELGAVGDNQISAVAWSKITGVPATLPSVWTDTGSVLQPTKGATYPVNQGSTIIKNQLDVEGASDGSNYGALIVYSHSASASAPPAFFFSRSRPSSAVVQSGDSLGSLQWNGMVSSGISGVSAAIRAIAQETFSPTGTGSRLSFSVASVGSATVAERLGIEPSGRVTLPGPGPSETIDQAAILLGTRTVKGRVMALPGIDWVGMTVNNSYTGSAWTQDDPAKPSWSLNMRSDTDVFQISHAPAGGGQTGFVTLSGAGQLQVPGPQTGSADYAPFRFGTRTIKGRLLSLTGSDYTYLSHNVSYNGAWIQDDAAKTGWMIRLATTEDNITFNRMPAGGPSPTTLLTLDSGGNLTIPGYAVIAGPLGYSVIFGPSPLMHGRLFAGNAQHTAGMSYNYDGAAQEDTSKPSWRMHFDIDGDKFYIQRGPAGGALSSVAFIDGLSSPAGDLRIYGNNATKATGTAWINPSDERIKRNVVDYGRGLEAILGLRPVSFEYNGLFGTTDDGHICYGFIAQEVQPVMPECVGTMQWSPPPSDPSEDTPDTPETQPAPVEVLTLDQSNMILALVNAVKELAARVAALEAA